LELSSRRSHGQDRAVDFPDVIEAEDITLRRWRPEDAKELAAAVHASLPELLPFMPWAHEAYDAGAAGIFIDIARDGWTDRTQWNYAALDRDGTLVGSFGLHDRIGRGALEIGYWLHSAHTGRGYATMAASALTRAALEQPGVERVVIKHDAANAASGAVAARAGFHEITRMDHEITAPGEVGVQVTWEYP
jgi:RimJ/RimL family protein N-acetyltransferase